MALPQTGFEERGHVAPWTTFAEEAAYLSALLAEVPSIIPEQVGVGSTGLPIMTYRLGTGPQVLYLVCAQHGNELSGREAVLSRIRDWATSTDPAIVDYLSKVTIIAMPTARPDSQGTRNNANGVNLNRDHVQVTQAETEAIQSVIRDWSPNVIVDLHEGANITNNYATSKSLNPNIPGPLLGLSAEIEDAVKAAIEGADYTWEPYQNWNITGPEYFSNQATIRNAVGLLLESRRTTGVNTDAALRYELQLIALDALVAWHHDNLERVAAACAAGRAAQSSMRTVELVGGTATSGTVVDPAPDGYLLTPAQETDLARPIAAFRLPVVDHDGGRMLSTRSETGILAHYLADAESPQRLASGERHYRQPPSAGGSTIDPPWPRFRIGKDGSPVEAAMVRLRSGGRTTTVYP